MVRGTGAAPTNTEKSVPVNLRPDPFKDRYKILFKYKKMPKVELKYNLGEQVKNMRSDVLKKDNVDVSKTRWPQNKINYRLSGQRVPQDQAGNSNFFMSMFPEKDIINYPPKYFKRELNNASNNDSENMDIKAIYVVGKSEIENTTFSLEKLIDSLIESSFDTNKSVNTIDRELEVVTNITSNLMTTIKPVTEQIHDNETTNVISINLTNENIDKNKYTDINAESNTTAFNQMIATLSKRIDIQNNTSMEMVRRISAGYDFDTTITTQRPKDAYRNDNIEIVTTENTLSLIEREIRPRKKSRQRFARRLQKSKHNK
ncbi:uncharacterized protein LOC142979122 [Anticarsia gemmatalis]|uniref:uncharacterized protein LOC142979122 n=1 Tax=Anticarsia gemmatalis TaxID=129554 RepID=UPI003F75B3CA